MLVNRRHLLQSAVAFGLIGTRSWAVTEADFGGFTIHSVSDGKLVLPIDFLLAEGADRSVADPILTNAGIAGSSYDAPLNVTLLRRGTDLVLFDVGSGPDFMPSAGELPAALEAIGVSPDQITHVLFTHAHPDHIWGALDDFDEPLFGNARHLIGRAERDFWMDPETMQAIDPARQSFVAGATRRIETLGDVLDVFEDGDEVAAGIIAMATPGHTPGHTSFRIDESAFVTGDMVTNAHLGFQAPRLPSGSDQDPEMAAETRFNSLKMLADAEDTIIGYHLPEGGIGRVIRDGDAFRFQPG